MSKSDDALRRQAERRKFEVGGGMWFRNSDNQQVVVTVQLYPRTVLRIDGTEIKRETLETEYHRLRV